MNQRLKDQQPVAGNFLADTLRAVEENLAALSAKVGEGDLNGVIEVQEATLGFVREKLFESWLRGVEHSSAGSETI